MNRRILVATAAIVVLLFGLLPGLAVGRSPNVPARQLPDSIKALKLAKPATDKTLTSKIHKSLAAATGRQKVYVRLKAAPSTTLAAAGAGAERAQGQRVRDQQRSFIASVRRLDAKVRILGQTHLATNIVAMQVDARQLKAIARNPNVISIRPVVNYQKALSETVPYIGATAVHNKGFDGKGIRVGVIDSGIDYTHVEFGGAGTAAAYEAAYGTTNDDPRNTTLDGLFPTARVVGGFDFVGESWPGDDGIEDPDPDPIDFEGHGTHVADIIGGTHGVAPKAQLFALKVCSSVDTACSGVGLMGAMDWALDPNGDGSSADHLDVLNMSLGADYGEAFDEDLSLAIDTASRLGVLTVAAAGNGGDLPYIAGTPANAKTALAVAETQVPSAVAYPLIVSAPPSIAGTYPNTEVLDWSGFTTGFSGNVTYVGQGCPADSIEPGSPEDPYLADPAGTVALIDRGACAVSLKVERAAQAGATAVIIGLIAPGDAYPFSNGGGTTFVPAISIQQSLSEAIKGALATDTVTVSIGSTSIALRGSMASTSSRGPSSPYNEIKPEIGAPGASVSAVAGSGTGMAAFGGTSGATPMVTGSMALLMQAFPSRTINELKALIVNNGETQIFNNRKTEPGRLAPITRIGGGEVRVDRAVASTAAAWDDSTKRATLSFGFLDATSRITTIDKTVVVHNYSSRTRTWKISSTFRFSDDRTNAAIGVSTPSSITVPSHASRTFRVRMVVHGSRLRAWQLDAGLHATDAAMLSKLEYDGYIWLDDTSTTTDNAKRMHLPWQILPRKSASISAPVSVAEGDTVAVTNAGIGLGTVDSYSLVARSPQPAGGPPRDEHADHRSQVGGGADVPGAGRLLLGGRLLRLRHRHQHLGAAQHHRGLPPGVRRPARHEPGRHARLRLVHRAGQRRRRDLARLLVRPQRPQRRADRVLLRRQRHQRRQRPPHDLRRADRDERHELLPADGHVDRCLRRLLHREPDRQHRRDHRRPARRALARPVRPRLPHQRRRPRGRFAADDGRRCRTGLRQPDGDRAAPRQQRLPLRHRHARWRRRRQGSAQDPGHALRFGSRWRPVDGRCRDQPLEAGLRPSHSRITAPSPATR